MNNLISLSYWFNSRPATIGIYGQKVLTAIALIMALVFIIIVIRAYSEKLSIYKPSIDKLIPFCLTNIVISVYIWFVNYEIVPVLRARVWYIIWFLVAIFWIIWIIKDFFKKARRRKQLEKEAEIKKYLP
jgi:hypothetical protein